MKKNFTDILMVFPSGGISYASNFKYSLGSAYIIAYLRKNGFNANQFITNESLNVKECVIKIMNYKPRIVGFTVYYSNYMQCVLISNGLKAFNSNIITIFGGPTPSVQPKDILKTIPSVDICVRWEGEETLLELVSALSENNYNFNKVNLVKIKGISFRKDSRIITNPDLNILISNRYIKNYLDKYPSPYLSKVIPASEASSIGIITARGCNQNCVYCNCAVISKRNIFFHSIERVIEELTYFSDSNKISDPISINDDSFTIIPTRAKKICEKIIENNIKIPLTCITRCDKVTEELLDLMWQAGFDSLGFSLESGVPRILRAIGKVNPPDDTSSRDFRKEKEFIDKLKRMTSFAKKIGMKPVFVSIMVGLPSESVQDAQKTLEVIKHLDIDFYQHNYFHIFKGTPIYQNYKKYGYKIRPLGKKNKIFTDNNFPFDVSKIKTAPRSTMEINGKATDYRNLKILSLNPKRKTQKHYFDNLIIYTDVIKQSLIKWSQENLAINGNIIHIYSNKLNYNKLHEQNLSMLYDEYSPTLYYEGYYWEKSNNISSLISGRTLFSGEEKGIPIKLKNTYLALEEYKNGIDNMENLICIDYSALDVQAIYNFLVNTSKNKEIFNYILNSRPLPHFQNLCRWTNEHANCQKLETAIIGNDDSIRICWYSEPIGKIGTPFLDIIRKLQHLHKEKAEERNCKECIEVKSCPKCLFPFPLSSEKYCEKRRKNNTSKPANIIYSLTKFKDLLFKPIIL
ncbi:MAG: B12-binding domain-containing radical SAM protein [Candidatus Hodarchaeota archaeon]